MNIGHIFLSFNLLVISVLGAVVPADEDIEEQGLYSKSDNVIILTNKNFDRKVYNQKYAILLQFYNSYCGHCRAFAPKFKNLAKELKVWSNIIRLAVIDCSVEDNNQICRQYEVMAYPSLRYVHEHFVKGGAELGDNMVPADSADDLKIQIIHKLQKEQLSGRLPFAPSLNIASYTNYETALSDQPKDVVYTFLIFEKENSTLGSELALDVNDYPGVMIKRVHDTCELANLTKEKSFPALVFVKSYKGISLTPNNPTKNNFLKAINTLLKSENYIFPVRDSIIESLSEDDQEETLPNSYDDIVYYSDLEKTIKTSLHTEITRSKLLTGEPFLSLLDYLSVIKSSFPFRYNLKNYITELHDTLNTKNEWTGVELYDLVKSLESKHAPVYSSQLEYIGCKGSQPRYRGYTCGLWTLFHTLTVNAARKTEIEGPNILKAMYGYVKYFFGCTECAQHFQAMAARNRLFDVKDNDKAVLWLWISHNEVNLRLAGDVTEDPVHPKIQFPSVKNCPECRLSRGAWNLSAVFQYLQKVYSAENLQTARLVKSVTTASSPFSNLDIGMLSLLYNLSS